jgi:UDP:flavonoid glycosyltransferase YjiC (YdhE family)
VYASLGTLQNGSEAIFRTIAEICGGLEAQLIISLGGGLDPVRLGTLPGDPVVVRFAPQLEILKRAEAVITHAASGDSLLTDRQFPVPQSTPNGDKIAISHASSGT